MSVLFCCQNYANRPILLNLPVLPVTADLVLFDVLLISLCVLWIGYLLCLNIVHGFWVFSLILVIRVFGPHTRKDVRENPHIVTFLFKFFEKIRKIDFLLYIFFLSGVKS